MIRRTIVMLGCLLILSACAGFDPRPRGAVTIYGRNDAPGDAWFGLPAAGDPPETVGFGSDVGVACLTGPAGTEVVSFDSPPNQGGQPQRSVGRVPGEGIPLVLWVDVAGDGTLTTGNGVPAWWVGDPLVC